MEVVSVVVNVSFANHQVLGMAEAQTSENHSIFGKKVNTANTKIHGK